MKDEFLSNLMKNLLLAREKFPNDPQNQWVATDILEVFRRFVESLESGTYSRHCHAIRWTCRDLKIKNDRASIDAVFQTTIQTKKENIL